MSFPFDWPTAPPLPTVFKFPSVTENSIGKLLRLEPADTFVWSIVIAFRFVHALLYHEGAPATAKFAVTVAGPFMIRLCGVVVPDSAPAKPENWYPLLAAELTDTTAPLLYQALTGLMVPPAAGFAAVVNAY